MHVHILGVCGTFMGGIAALARAAGHRVTGSDQSVYPPMSDQLAALGIELIEGYEPEQLKLKPDVVVVGNVMSRGNRADRSAARKRHSVHVRARMAGAARAGGTLDARGRGHARQDDDFEHPRLDSRVRRARPGLPDRRRARQFQRHGAPRRRPAFRRRGGRIRHGVLRQARQVRSLPAAHRGAEQPRARPRGHLSGRRVDPVAVPSTAAHGAAQRPGRRERRRRERHARDRHGLLDAGRAVRGERQRRHGVVCAGARRAATTRGSLSWKAIAAIGEVDWPMLGRHNAENALAAILAARHAGVDVADRRCAR